MNKPEKEEEQDECNVLGWKEPGETKNFYEKSENMVRLG